MNKQNKIQVNIVNPPLSLAGHNCPAFISEEAKENTNCASYDSGYCETYPTPYSMKCEDITDCINKELVFSPDAEENTNDLLLPFFIDAEIGKLYQTLKDIRALSLKFISDLDDKYKYEKGLFRIFIRKIDEVLNDND